MANDYGVQAIVAVKVADGTDVATAGSGAVLFCDSDDRPTTAIRAKTADGAMRDVIQQSGAATLVAGTTALLPATVTASSRILLSLKTPDTKTDTTEYAALGTDRVVGIGGAGGGFKITALVAAGTINVADVSVIDWVVFN